MNKEILNCKKHIHFIGIGGSGMYPLVQILHTKGYYITGSDNNESETLQAVRDMGIPVMMGQRAENIEGADLIVYTAAIMADNPELIAAKAAAKLPAILPQPPNLFYDASWIFTRSPACTARVLLTMTCVSASSAPLTAAVVSPVSTTVTGSDTTIFC